MQSSARTQAQVEASRHNGSQSKGPVTSEGKARAAANSVRHGLCSTELRFADANEQEKFEALRKELIFTHRANTEAMKMTVDRMAAAMWRTAVADNLEFALFDAVALGQASMEEGGSGLPSLKTLNRYRSRLAKDIKEAEERLEKLRAERAKAFQAQMEKQKEFKEMDLFKSVAAEIGDEAMRGFVRSVLNEPGDLPHVPLVQR